MTVDAPAGVWTFEPVERVVYGPATTSAVREAVERIDATRVLVVTSPSVGASSIVATIEHSLSSRRAATFAQTRAHLPVSSLLAAIDCARDVDADAIVGVGGGSSIDCAKLTALGLAEGWRAPPDVEARGPRPPTVRPVPTIAVPTTLVGAPFTAGAGTVVRPGHKALVLDPLLAPNVVVLDGEAARDTPDALWAASGIRALDHAIERLLAPEHQPIARALGRDAIRRLLEHLPPSIGSDTGVDSNVIAHRVHCQVAAWHAMFGPHNTTWGLSTVAGRIVGARTGIAHSLTSALMMPAVVRHVGNRDPAQLAAVAEALGTDTTGAAIGDAAAARLLELVARLGLPARLRDVGVEEHRLDELVRMTHGQLSPALGYDAADVDAVFRAAR